MSRNNDNWERLVAAVIKRQQIWELCHQPSRTPRICSEYSTPSDLSSSFRIGSDQNPIPKLLEIKRSLKSIQNLGKGRYETSTLTKLRQDAPFSDQQFLPKGTPLVMKKLFGEVVVTEEEFKALFGDCRQENVAATRGYYSKKENFIFYDYPIQRSFHDELPFLSVYARMLIVFKKLMKSR